MKLELSQRAGRAMKGIYFDDALKSQFIADLEQVDTFDELVQRAQNIILFGEKNNKGFSDTRLPQAIIESYGETKSDMQNRNLPANYRIATDEKRCGNCVYFGKGFCDFWDEEVKANYVCNKFESSEDDEDGMHKMPDGSMMDNDEMDEDEYNAELNLVPPVFMRAAARRGLKLHEEGKGGDGLVPATIRDARKMMNGEPLSREKWEKIGPWIARHMVDLDAPKNRNTDDAGYPGAGLVAHLLWGSGPSKANAQRAMDYANRLADRFDEHRLASRPAPKSDQIKGSSTNPKGSAQGKTGSITLNDATTTALQTKASEHNKKMADGGRPPWTRVRLGSLKAVYRRGAGAFSTSHRPGIPRPAWAMARVNAFLVLARTGRPNNPKYVGDNDLLHRDHPRYSKGK